MDQDDWDDLRFLLAVDREGSLSGAATQLGVDHTTVSRRVRRLEERRGARLVERVRGGVTLTPLGEAFVAAAADIERRLHELDLTITGSASELKGSVRLTLPTSLAQHWIEELADFARAQPAVSLELIVDEELRSLNRREADVALRYTASPPEHLVGRRLGTVALAVYGSPELRGVPLGKLPWIGWEPGIETGMIERFRRRYSPDEPVVMYANSMAVVIEAARRAKMVTVLACVTGDADPALVRLTEPEDFGASLWVLTHPDLRHSPRIRAVMRHISTMVGNKKNALLGVASP